MIYNLQPLRAIAAFLVMFVHMDLFAKPLGLSRESLEFGNVGVDLFFVLSGFLMVYTTSGRSPTAREFFQNRVVRVVPLYWVCTMAVFSIAILMPNLLGATKANFFEFLKSLAFVPFLKSNGLVMPVLFVGWTLNFEMLFYLIFAIFLHFTKSHIRITAVCSIVSIITLVIFGKFFPQSNVIFRFFTNSIMLEFGFGMFAALVLGQSRALPKNFALPILAAAAIALLFGESHLRDLPRFLVWGVPAALVLLSCVSLERNDLVMRLGVFQLLGDASYALYLTHAFVLQGIGKMLPANAASTVVLAALLVSIVLAQVVAILVHKIIEIPLTNQLRAFLRRGRHNVPKAAGA